MRRRLSVGSRGPRIGHTTVLVHGPSAYWASLEPGEDLGIVEELEGLHDVRVQSDDGVVIIGGFVIHQPVWRLLPLLDRRRVVIFPLRIGGKRLALALHDCRV